MDRFVFLLHPRTGLASLTQLAKERYPLRVSVRTDATHSTRILLDQLFALHHFTVADLKSWGGKLVGVRGPGDERRLAALERQEVDAVADEGLGFPLWFDQALAGGLEPLALEPHALAACEAMGWRPAVVPAGSFPHLRQDCPALDYSGWPLYTRASLPDQDAYDICAAVGARAGEIPWEGSFTDVGQLGRQTEATPMDVPLHPGAARWYAEHASPPPHQRKEPA